MIAGIFRIRSNPGLAGLMTGRSEWSSSIVQTTIGRDRTLDILPSGTKRYTPSDANVVEKIRGDFARMEKRYDLIVIAAPTGYVQRGRASIIPGPDVILCARIAHTRIARLKEEVESLRALDLRIQGLVLWNDDMPVIEAQDEQGEPGQTTISGTSNLAGVR